MTCGVLLRHRVADGIGDIDRGGAGLDRRFDDLARESRARCGRRLRARTRRRRNSSRARCTPSIGPLRRSRPCAMLQLEFAMNRAGGQEDVDARTLRRPSGRRQARSMSSRLQRARPADGRAVHVAAIGCTASKSPGEAIGKAGFDDIDAQIRQRLRHSQLFLRGSCCSRATARRRAAWCRR